MPIVRARGELDAHGARNLQKAARDIMGQSDKRAIIDLRDCTYIDSAVLAILFSLVSWAGQRGGRLAAVRPPVRILHVVRMVRLRDEPGFQVFADLDSALASFSGARAAAVRDRPYFGAARRERR